LNRNFSIATVVAGYPLKSHICWTYILLITNDEEVQVETTQVPVSVVVKVLSADEAVVSACLRLAILAFL